MDQWFPVSRARQWRWWLRVPLVGAWIAWALLAGDADWAAAVAVLLALLTPGWVCAEAGLELDDQGLTSVSRFGGRRRRATWAQVRGVSSRRGTVWIDAAEQSFRVDRLYEGWRELYREVERRTARDGDPPDQVDEDQVARLLGIERDGLLVCRPQARWSVFWAVVPVPVVIAALVAWSYFDWNGDLWSAGGWAAVGAALAIIAAGAALSTRERRRQAVLASAGGLEVRRGRRWLFVPWSALRRLTVTRPSASRCYSSKAAQAADRRIGLETDEGLFEFHRLFEGGEQLETGLTRLLDARERGAVLPTGAAISAAAISPARLGGERSAERGLTQVTPHDG